MARTPNPCELIDAPAYTCDYIQVKPLSYGRYIALIQQLGPCASWDAVRYDEYRAVYTRLWSFKWEYLSPGSISYLLLQLLTGCRASALPDLAISQVGSVVQVDVPGVKSGYPSSFTYQGLPLALTHLFLHPSPFRSLPSYFQYRRELRAAGPNFFMSSRAGHLTCTHLPRYFFIQALHHVLCMPLSELTNLLGWKRGESVSAYLDPQIWSTSQGG
ncbi:hypothetical protein ES705_31311 [subsurface metagenome]